MEVDDDDEGMDFIRNVAPRHPSRILERSDGSDDDDGEVEIPCSSRRSSFIGDDCPPLVEVEDSNDEMNLIELICLWILTLARQLQLLWYVQSIHYKFIYSLKC